MKNRALHKEMGTAILARLKDFTDLPETGFVAGQAVASAVSELFGDGRAVKYNDVDVFREQPVVKPSAKTTDSQIESLSRVNKQCAIQTCMFSTMEFQFDYSKLTGRTINRYKVRKATRTGLLNDIFCDFQTTNRVDVLRTFDLNCTQIGVDLATSNLVWTPEFQRFQDTRQLELVTLHTPFHSLIRFFKKMEELEGIYGNEERALELVAAAYYLEIINNKRDEPQEYSDLRWNFGKNYAEKLTKVGSKIFPHFSSITETIQGYPVTRLVPRFEVESDLLEGSATNSLNVPHVLPRVSRALREKHVPGMQARLNYLAKNVNNLAAQSLVSKHWLMANDDSYVKGNVTPAQMASMDKITKAHSISHMFPRKTLELDFARFLLIKKEVAKRGLWVYGALENRIPCEGLSDSEVIEHLDKSEQYLGQVLKKASLPTVQLGPYSVKELTTGMELVTEGVELHHCIGGYSQSVKQGYSEVFSFRAGLDPNNWFTAEFKTKDFVSYCSQVNGLLNRSLTDDEFAKVRTLLIYRNLAKVLGGYLTGKFISIAPERAVKLGLQVTKLYSTLGRIKETPGRWSVHFADKLELGRSVSVNLTKTSFQFLYANQHVFRFWLAHLKLKLGITNDDNICKHPAYKPIKSASDSEEIPF